MARFRYRLLVVGLLTVVLQSAIVAHSPDEARAGSVRMIDWNAAGASSTYGNGAPGWLTSTLKPHIQQHGTAAVILQEVCRSQVIDIYNKYLFGQGFGPAASFYPARNGGTACGGVGQEFGNAVFMQGGGVTSARPFANSNQVNGASTVEKRGIACLNAYTIPLLACSMHLVDSNVPFADCQAADAWGPIITSTSQGYRIVAGGDFNIKIGTAEDGPPTSSNQCPHWTQPQTSLEYIYTYYTECDQPSPPSTRPTHSLGKLDAVFANQFAYFSSDVLLKPSASDHSLLVVYIAW